MNKHCEFCGKESNNSLRRWITDPPYFIFLDSPHVKYHDSNEHYVVIENENQDYKIDYTVRISENKVVKVDNLTSHIFCSESCEDRFLEKHGSIFNEKNLKEVKALVNLDSLGIFLPLSFPIDQFEHNKKYCKSCKEEFPILSSSFIIREINKYTKVKNHYTTFFTESIDTKPKQDLKKMMDEERPNIDHHEILISDVNKNNPRGYYHLYEYGYNIEENFSFCSNECIFSFCEENNSICFFESNFEKGMKVIISPETKKINELLLSPYKFRPSVYSDYQNNERHLNQQH